MLWLDTVRCGYRDYKFVKYHNFDPNSSKFSMVINKGLINYFNLVFCNDEHTIGLQKPK